jgi:hypothetical protein
MACMHVMAASNVLSEPRRCWPACRTAVLYAFATGQGAAGRLWLALPVERAKTRVLECGRLVLFI